MSANLFDQTLQMAGAPRPGAAPVDPTGQVRPTNRPSLDQMDEGALVKWSDEQFDRGTGHRRHVERAALLGLAFLLDQHYVDFQGSAANAVRLVAMPNKPGRIRTIEQIIEPAYRGELARMLRTRPRGVVVPDGMDPEDYEASEAADRVLTHVLHESDFEIAVTEAVGWQIVSGNALLATHWDPEQRDRGGDPGMVRYRSLGPFEFAVAQPRTTRLQDQPWVMITKRYELDEVEDTWGIRVRPDEHGTWGALDERIEAVIAGGTRSSTAHTKTEEVVVKETWIKPSPLAPEGAVLITAGGRMLDLQVWPRWCEGRYPMGALRFIDVPGSFWAKGFLQALIPLQRRHNRAASTNLELLNMLSQVSVAVPRGTQVRQVLGGRGTMFESPAGATQPVSNIQPPPLGDLAYRELEHTRQATKDISYQHEVSKGYTPPNVRSGTAISMLKEMDDSASSVPLRSLELATERAGEVTLAIVKEKWDHARAIRVVSAEGDLEAVSLLSGADVGGHFMVQAGSSWPYTKAERQGMILQWYDRGIIDGPEALELADLGATASEVRNKRKEDYRHARRENQKFERMQMVMGPDGKPTFDPPVPIPQDWHNHLVHLEVHQSLRKSPKYERFAPHVQMAFEAHIMGHMAALQAQMQAQAQAAAPQPPPPRPAPPPPPEEDEL